jgi:fumarate hydratase subunit alpha
LAGLNLDISNTIENTALELIRSAMTRLPPEVKGAINKAYAKEDSKIGRMILKTIIDNIKLAEKLETPLCQDTGLIIFYAKVGDKFGSIFKISKALTAAVKRATVEIPLRPNVVHPISRRNTGDNTGIGIPPINWSFTEGDSLELTVLPKGAGAENKSTLMMCRASEGIEAIKEGVIDTVIKAGGQPCPPIILGVGIGGSAELAMSLAKKALLRPIDQPNPERGVAKLEKALFEAINKSGIGPMGLGGRVSTLGVNVEYAYCHTASLPVGINFQCWCARRASAKINRDGVVMR